VSSTRSVIRHKLEQVFTEPQAAVLAEVVEAAYTDLVKTSDFNELKSIVRDLATAQNEMAAAQVRTEERLTRVEIAVEKLAEAQKRTETRVEELAEAQKRTEERLTRVEIAVEKLAEAQKRTEMRVEELAEAQKQTQQELQLLAKGLRETRGELGGLSRSVGYALENEAYRALPRFLKEHYGLEVTQRLIRTEIGGEEINLFGRARRNGQSVLIVGEVKLRLDERRTTRRREDALAVLEKKIAAVKAEHGAEEIVPLLVAHYARPSFLQKAQAKGVIVVQSFEW